MREASCLPSAAPRRFPQFVAPARAISSPTSTAKSTPASTSGPASAAWKRRAVAAQFLHRAQHRDAAARRRSRRAARGSRASRRDWRCSSRRSAARCRRRRRRAAIAWRAPRPARPSISASASPAAPRSPPAARTAAITASELTTQCSPGAADRVADPPVAHVGGDQRAAVARAGPRRAGGRRRGRRGRTPTTLAPCASALARSRSKCGLSAGMIAVPPGFQPFEDLALGVGDRLFAAEHLDMRGGDRGDDRDVRADLPGQRGDLAGVVHAHLEHAEARCAPASAPGSAARRHGCCSS